jgi:dTDP-4-dehydrorhamnose reductase
MAQASRCDVPHRAFGHAQCDITDRLAVKSAVEGSRFVVNCAAYTSVDQAETDVEAAYRVNASGAENVATACAEAGIALLHLSTDYVFDGESPRPAREEDAPRPLNVYGASKLAGEAAIRNRVPSHIILRTSWVFSADGQNFVRTILRLARTQSTLRVVADQVGGPTAADDIAKAILEIAHAAGRPGFADWGTYHFSGTPPVSWHEFAGAILRNHGVAVRPIATKDYPSPARRPANSVLDCSRIYRVFGVEQPDWRPALSNVLAALGVAQACR